MSYFHVHIQGKTVEAQLTGDEHYHRMGVHRGWQPQGVSL